MRFRPQPLEKIPDRPLFDMDRPWELESSGIEEISYDEDGNVHGGTFMDYLLPTAVETPKWETGETVTPSPHHPIGAKGVGESATVGAPPAIANAVIDAVWHLGIRNIDIPITPAKVWAALKEKGAALEE